MKKTTYTYTSVRERSCCSIVYDELDRASEIWYTVNDNESKAYASVLLAKGWTSAVDLRAGDILVMLGGYGKVPVGNANGKIGIENGN